MVLVCGATGLLGSDICRRLRTRGLAVRALARPGSARAADLKAIGVEIVNGDLRSRASIDEACRDVASVMTTATAMGSKDKSLRLRAVDRDAHLQLVEAARAAGARRFIQISVSPNLTPAAPLVKYKRQIEDAITGSGMQWTILQPSVFMEVWLSPLLGWDFARARATIFGSGVAPISYISVGDVAEYAVRSLDDVLLDNRELPLGGPEALAPNDVVKIFEEVSGRRYKVRRIPRPFLAAMAPVASLVNEATGSGMSLGAQTGLGDVIQSPIQKKMGLRLTSVRDYASRVAAEAANPSPPGH
jgi:uncharacterized protein YbjT (DUF2867 family)